MRGGETIVCDKGYSGREFSEAVARLGGRIVRPARRDESQRGPRLAPIRQRIESIFFTCKDLLARVGASLLALAACVSLNHQLGRPSRAIVDYTA